jgi:hypothetical protein
MKKDSLNERRSSNLPNTTIDVGYVVDPNPISGILVFAEFVWENMLEMVSLWDSEKLVGKLDYELYISNAQ